MNDFIPSARAEGQVLLDENDILSDTDAVELRRRVGMVIKYNLTPSIFTTPKDKRTEDYITGRFG